MKYVYTAVFSPEDESYSVHFPDIPGCVTCGDNLGEAIDMAQDVLCLWLYHNEQEGKVIPAATHSNKIKTGGDEFITAISVDTDDYRRYYENKLVKKTLNIPSWLNAKAEAANINFSQTLQQALKETLQLQ
ncbi:MAG: type II toxin-antitoxin system HicB family antitoxin [Synergistaceae bacterium]|nr:type II toxin-antitoxin system HicB family antitoxin [Synergistaceae bacterium]